MYFPQSTATHYPPHIIILLPSSTWRVLKYITLKAVETIIRTNFTIRFNPRVLLLKHHVAAAVARINSRRIVPAKQIDYTVL